MPKYIFNVKDQNTALAGQSAAALINKLNDLEVVNKVDREKQDNDTQDLGTIVTALATSGASIAIAQGVAAWLMARRGASLIITIEKGDESIKAHVSGINPKSAERIIETVSRGIEP